MSKSVFVIGMLALAMSYTIVAVHTPLTIFTPAVHDDAWFIAMGRYLSEGEWLGPFNQFTLMKGPGYPAFLALGQWLGISVSLAQALLHCAAITLLVAACHRFLGSLALSALLLILLLWHPIPLTDLLRVIRDAIYYSQSLLLFAAAILALFVFPGGTKRVGFAMLAGAAAGWLWLTREEGIWIVPGLAVLLAFAAVRAIREKSLHTLGATVLVFVAAFAATQIVVAGMNRLLYGQFSIVDMKEKNFDRALAALASVRSGGVRPYVVVTQAARQRIYAVSPSFALLAKFLDTPPGQGWAGTTCSWDPSLCGEIGSGWFLYALRDATAAAGYYGTPSQASAFFGKLANEIESACRAGALECSPQPVFIMPPVNWPEVMHLIPARLLYAFELFTRARWPADVPPSSGTEEEMRAALRFLNYPVHTPSSQLPVIPVTYKLSGWYHRSGDEWIAVTVRTQGVPGEARIERYPSPDVAEVFHDPAASWQRFIIHASCSDNCWLQFAAANGARAERWLAGLRHTPVAFALGAGRVRIDRAELLNNAPLRSQEVSNTIRTALLAYYDLLYVPVLAIGAITFLITTVLRWRSVGSNTCYIIAAAAWVMVFSRTALLLILDVTTFPGVLESRRLAPAYFFAACAAVMSCASCLQLFRTPRTVPQKTRTQG